MLLSRFGKLESVDKIATECLASMVLEQSLYCAGPCLCLFDAGEGISIDTVSIYGRSS